MAVLQLSARAPAAAARAPPPPACRLEGARSLAVTGSWTKSGVVQVADRAPPRRSLSSAPTTPSAATRRVTRMGNAATGGPFAPLVRVVRNAMGVKEFNQFRGKAISLHSQVIKEFGKSIGADSKQVQGLIRLAKKNGEKLGFLA